MKSVTEIFDSNSRALSPALTFLMERLMDAQTFLNNAAALKKHDTPHQHHIYVAKYNTVVIHSDFGNRTASQRAGTLASMPTEDGTPCFTLTFRDIGTLVFDGNAATEQSNLMTLWHMIEVDTLANERGPDASLRPLAA